MLDTHSVPSRMCVYSFFNVNHCSLTFCDIITLLARHSVLHFPEFLPGVILSGKVNYLIIFKGAINCTSNVWDGLKAIELPDRWWTKERLCRCSSFVELYNYFPNIKIRRVKHSLAITL